MYSGLCLESKDTGACSWAACLAPCTIKVEKFTSNSSLPGSHVSQSTHAFASPLTWERTIGDNVRWWLSMSKAAWMKLTNTAWGWKMEGEVPRTSVVVITEPAQLYPSYFAGNLVCVCHRSVNGIVCLAFSYFQMINFWLSRESCTNHLFIFVTRCLIFSLAFILVTKGIVTRFQDCQNLMDFLLWLIILASLLRVSHKFSKVFVLQLPDWTRLDEIEDGGPDCTEMCFEGTFRRRAQLCEVP